MGMGGGGEVDGKAWIGMGEETDGNAHACCVFLLLLFMLLIWWDARRWGVMASIRRRVESEPVLVFLASIYWDMHGFVVMAVRMRRRRC